MSESETNLPIDRGEVVDKPKDFSALDLPQQVHALCLAARKEVDLDRITQWITFSRGELATEQLQIVQDTYRSLQDTIKWGDQANSKLIETLFGASSKSVRSVIFDSAASKIFRNIK